MRGRRTRTVAGALAAVLVAGWASMMAAVVGAMIDMACTDEDEDEE